VVPEKMQPTLEEIMIGVLMFPGPVVTKRSFKQSAGRKIRGIVDSEVVTALERLEKDGCGVIKKLRASVNARRETVVFVKLEELPGEIALVSRDEYRKKFQLPPIHKAISEAKKMPICNTLCACNK
jgi:hypothetical protein